MYVYEHWHDTNIYLLLKINKSEAKQELKLIQICLSLVRVEFRGLYTEFENHISTLI